MSSRYDARGRLRDEEHLARRGSPELQGSRHGTPPTGTPPTGTPLLSPRNLPRPSTPSTRPATPTHSGTPPPGPLPPYSSLQLEALSLSRKNSLQLPGTDSRRSSLTKKSLTDLAQDAKKGMLNVKDTSMKAGQKVKDRTATVSGQMKDATVGASQWVASQTSRTAKLAMEQAKTGMSFGEKFTLYAVEKISRFSHNGFTHVFMFLVLTLYTALGALLFIAVEAPHENEEKNDIENERNRLLEKLWDHHTYNRGLNYSSWQGMAVSLLKSYDDQLYHSWSVGISPDTDERIWTFWKAMFFCSTITTTIGYGHIFPRTNAGRALSIVYAILGIPIFLILMADFGKLFTRLLKGLFVLTRKMYRTSTCIRLRKTRAVQSVKKGWRQAGYWCSTTICRRRRDTPVETPESEEENYEALLDDNFNLPISLAMFILLVYIMIGCVLYTMWENWTYFEAFYFIFISMTTIGFGDYVPDHPAFMMMTTVYLLFGLALTAMCINIIQEKLTDTFRAATEKMKESIHLMVNSGTQGEDGDLLEGKEVEVAMVHSVKKTSAVTPDEEMEAKKNEKNIHFV